MAVQAVKRPRNFRQRVKIFKKLKDNKKLGGANCLIWKDGHILLQESYGLKIWNQWT